MQQQFTKRWALPVTAAAALVLAGCAASDQAVGEHADNGAIFQVQDPWIKATEASLDTSSDTSMTGAFAHLTNVSGRDQTIIAAHADVAGLVELHEVVTDGGVNLMQEKPGGFPVAAEATYELNPGQDHIMLMELDGHIQPGDLVEITLELEDGQTQRVEFMAKEFVGAQENYDDLDHHESHQD